MGGGGCILHIYVYLFVYLCHFSRKNFRACLKTLKTLNDYSINLLELCYYTHQISPSKKF